MKKVFIVLMLMMSAKGGIPSYLAVTTTHAYIGSQSVEYTLLERTSVNKYTKALMLDMLIMKKIIHSLHNTLPYPMAIINLELEKF